MAVAHILFSLVIFLQMYFSTVLVNKMSQFSKKKNKKKTLNYILESHVYFFFAYLKAAHNVNNTMKRLS